jgi:(+)-neomenthol dehydrogenase
MDKSSCEATEEWWRKETVAVVTGANRGIGVEIVRLLADKGITVVLTARCRQQQDLSQRSRALMEEGRKNVVFHTLDIQRDDSVDAFAQWLKNEFGGLDILINNAAVGGVKVDWDLLEKRQMDFRKILEDGSCAEALTEDEETAKECLGTNYYGTKRITKALIPLLKPSTAEARIVNVSSVLGLLMFLRNDPLQRQLSDIENIGEEVIDCLVKQFMEDIERGADLGDSVWPVRFPTYSLSKVALNAYTRLLARDLNGKACVNSVHPGYVRTSMTFDTGDISSVEGAEYVVRVALLPPSGPSGQNFLRAQIAPF